MEMYDLWQTASHTRILSNDLANGIVIASIRDIGDELSHDAEDYGCGVIREHRSASGRRSDSGAMGR
jgi:hypothetical protein